MFSHDERLTLMFLAGMADALVMPPKMALAAARRERAVFIINYILVQRGD